MRAERLAKFTDGSIDLDAAVTQSIARTSH
jgi:hypothetical protein